jgi:hypothetical protein
MAVAHGCIAFGLSAIFPPYLIHDIGSQKAGIDAGIGFVFSPPATGDKAEALVFGFKLCYEWAVVGVTTILEGVLILRADASARSALMALRFSSKRCRIRSMGESEGKKESGP